MNILDQQISLLWLSFSYFVSDTLFCKYTDIESISMKNPKTFN